MCFESFVERVCILLSIAWYWQHTENFDGYLKMRWEKEILLVFGFIVCAVVMSLSKSVTEYRVLLLAGQIRSACTWTIAKKLLKIRKNSISHGKVLNTISSDMELFELLLFASHLLGSILCTLTACIVIYYFFGSSGLIGILVSVFHLPLI